MRELSQRSSKRRRLVHIVVLSLLLIGIGMLLPRLISAVAAGVMYPVHATNTWLEESSSLIPAFIRDRRELQTKIESLENELTIAERADLTQQRLIEENRRLRNLLGNTETKRVAAAVIARPNELPYDLLQIDRGARHGVTVGAPVFIGPEQVIGLVVHAAPTYAFVELATTPGFIATAFISGPDIVATMEGVGGGVARVRVPQGVPLQIGNLVHLPSVEPGLFGRISHIENRPTQPEQYGYITSVTPISGLHQVAVGAQSQISHAADEIDARILEQMKSELRVEGVSVGRATSTATSTEATATSTEPD